jgi:NADH-quinone oxidoreductase subunit E
MCSEATNTLTLPQKMFEDLDQYIEQLNIDLKSERRTGYLIQVLHKAQGIFGYLPEPVQKHIAGKVNVSHAEVSGVISFYNFFTTKPKGKYKISICMGTACFVKGAEKVLDEFSRYLKIDAGEVTDDGKYSLDVLRCVGACGLAPVVLVNDKVYGNVATKQVGDIVAECISMEAKS